MHTLKTSACIAIAAVWLGACMQTAGGGAAGLTTGGSQAAATDGAENQNGTSTSAKKTALIRCDAPIATVLLSTEQQTSALAQIGLPTSTLPAMRLVARQTNCFTIVNRELALQAAAAGQSGSAVTPGRIVPPQYTIMVEVLAHKEQGGAGSAASMLAGFIPYVGGIASSVASGVRTHDAQVLLTLVDNRSAVEVTSVTGSASNASYNLVAGGYGDAGGYDSTEQGKAVIAAMVDAMNQLIPQIAPGGKPRM